LGRPSFARGVRASRELLICRPRTGRPRAGPAPRPGRGAVRALRAAASATRFGGPRNGLERTGAISVLKKDGGPY